MRMLIWLIDTGFSLLNLLIFVRVIISWVSPGHVDPAWRKVLAFIYKTTEPILAPFRRLIPTGNIGLDFSPLVAIFVLMIVKNFIINLLLSLYR